MSINDHEAKEKEYNSNDPASSTDNHSSITENADETAQQVSSQDKISHSVQDASVQDDSTQTTAADSDDVVSDSDVQSAETQVVAHKPVKLPEPTSDATHDKSPAAAAGLTPAADSSADDPLAQSVAVPQASSEPVRTTSDSDDIASPTPDYTRVDSASAPVPTEAANVPVVVPFDSTDTGDATTSNIHSTDTGGQDDAEIVAASPPVVENALDDEEDEFESTAKRPAVVFPPQKAAPNTPSVAGTTTPPAESVPEVIPPVTPVTPAATHSSITPPKRPTAKPSSTLPPSPGTKSATTPADTTVVVRQNATPPKRPTAKPSSPPKSSPVTESATTPADTTIVVRQNVTPPKRPTAKPSSPLNSSPAVESAVTPPERPQANQVITPNQEKGSRYLTWKRSLKDHLTIPMPVVKSDRKQQGDGHGENGLSATDLIASQKTTQLVVPNTPALQRPASTPPPSGRRDLARMPTRALGALPVSSFGDVYPRRAGKPLTPEEMRQLHRKRVLLRHISRRNMRDDRSHGHRGTIRVWATILTIIAVFVIIFFSVAGAGSYISYQFYNNTQAQFLPKVLDLHNLTPKDNLKIYDSNQLLLTQVTKDGTHTTVSYEQISPYVVDAAVATEDKNFWTNPGIDINRIVQSAFDDLRAGRNAEGGSTITEQLVKNLVIGNQDKTYIRKLQELAITPEVNAHYSKKDIMSMYLNSIYYGEQADGIDAAAAKYFGLQDQPGGKSAAAQLDVAQSAMLAGIPNSPSAYDPLLHPEAAYNRFSLVLQFMLKNGYITRVQQIDAETEAKDPNFYKTSPIETIDRAPHFTQLVLTELEQKYHMTLDQVARSGFSVTTTLDINLQDKVQKIAQQQIAAVGAAYHVSNAAEVIIDPHTGAIRTLLGSIDYNNRSIDGQVDVTQSYRQPGSSFKPFVYLAAFESGASPAQAVDDSPLSIPQAGGPAFTPGNYSNTFAGHMTLRCALQNSLNIPAVKVLQHVGIPAALAKAKAMGISSYVGYPGYSLVLGSLGVKLLDETSAYGTFANAGKHVPYYAIEKVTNMNNNQVDQHQQDPGTQVTDPKYAFMMSSVLSDNTSRQAEFLDCNVLQLYANSQLQCNNGNRGRIIPAAVKTGTTNDFKDNWTVGYTSDYVMGVWTGNDDNSAMSNGVTGVVGAAPIWHDSLLVAEQGKQPHDFVNPGGLQQETVTYADGVRSTDWFVAGKAPKSAQINSSAIASMQSQMMTDSYSAKSPPTQHTKAAAPFCSTFNYAFGPTGSDPLSGINPNPGPNGWW